MLNLMGEVPEIALACSALSARSNACHFEQQHQFVTFHCA